MGLRFVLISFESPVNGYTPIPVSIFRLPIYKTNNNTIINYSNGFKHIFIFPIFFLQLHFDNDREARRERDVRLTGNKLDLNFCSSATRANATTLNSIRAIDTYGNDVSTLSSPQSTSSNNNVSPTHDEIDKFMPMSPSGKFFGHLTFKC